MLISKIKLLKTRIKRKPEKPEKRRIIIYRGKKKD